MIINCPLSASLEVEPLIKAGAREFYCGLLPPRLSSKTIDFELINRRPDYGANFSSLDELYKAKKIADKYNAKLAITLNEFYPQPQLDQIVPLLRDIRQIGITEIIVADIGLLKYVTDFNQDLEITISIMASVFNPQAVSLLRKICPRIKKIMLPCHLSFDAIRNIVNQNPGIEFETFIFNEICHYEVGLCNYTHNPYRKNYFVSIIKRSPLLDRACQAVFQDNLPTFFQNKFFEYAHIYPCHVRRNDLCLVTKDPFIKPKKNDVLSVFLKNLKPEKMIFGCGVCFLPQLTAADIKYVKIGGRNNSLKKKIRNLSFVVACLKKAEQLGFRDRDDVSTEWQKLFSKFFRCHQSDCVSCKNFCCFSS